MPFGLKNTGATFQRAMDLAFTNEKDVFLVVYLDDVRVFSKSYEEHMYHLKTVLQMYRKYDLSLNPKRSLFAMEEGKLLGNIISKYGIRIDPTHKTDDHERPIAFFSTAIRHAAIKYNIIEKQALALVKALKDFWVYILHSHILAYVLNTAVKDVLVQTDPEGRRGKWIVALLEYDVEIKPTKLVKGQGLEKLMRKDHQFRWILTVTDYFTKWIKAISTKQATNAVIISFLENKILSRFGCPNKLITDNVAAFKSKRMVEFCHKYDIILGHSTAYHPQGNGLVESLNKSLVNIIKKLLEINKKSLHKRLVNTVWADRVSQKKSIGTSPFELVYGVDTVFPTSLVAPVVKLLQEADSEDDPM
eukprot:PITA_16702